MSILLLALDPDKLDEVLVEKVAEVLVREGSELELVVTRDRDRIEELAEKVVVAAGAVPYDLMRGMTALEWFQQWGAGADWLRRHQWAREARFEITNVAGIHGQQIAEHVFAMLLAFARRLPEALQAKARRQWWKPAGEELLELGGRSMLVLGFGAIGARIAEIAHAFGMRVRAVKRTPAEPPPWVEELATMDELASLLPSADVIVVALPLTEQTHGLIGRRALSLMRPGAVLVNIGRGAVVDEAALVDALHEGRLRAALLDVFEEEPLPPSSALWGRDDVLVTAHYSGDSPRYDERAMEIFLDNLGRFLREEELTHRVDRATGY